MNNGNSYYSFHFNDYHMFFDCEFNEKYEIEYVFSFRVPKRQILVLNKT